VPVNLWQNPWLLQHTTLGSSPKLIQVTGSVQVAIPFDIDMVAYAWTMLKIIFGSKARLRQNSPPLPARLEYEQVPEEQVTAAQREYLRPIDEQLAALNYMPICTFRAKNYANSPTRKHLLRRYGNPSDPASCGLVIVEVKTHVQGIEGCKNSSTAEFTTRFSDGKRLTTRNMPRKSLFDQPPERMVQECPNVTNLAELKRRHDARAQKLGVPVPPRQEISAIFAELVEEHQRNTAYQLERGNYRLAPDGASYLLTDKVFNRGIRNHFLPFGRRVSLTQALFTALIGAVFPLFGILKLAPWIVSSAYEQAAGIMPMSWIAIAVCYLLAGVIMGATCDATKFTWIMLVTYVPAHLIAGWTFGWFPYSTLAFNGSYFVAQALRRRKLVLQT
jgi:hypothetical protein